MFSFITLFTMNLYILASILIDRKGEMTKHEFEYYKDNIGYYYEALFLMIKIELPVTLAFVSTVFSIYMHLEIFN